MPHQIRRSSLPLESSRVPALVFLFSFSQICNEELFGNVAEEKEVDGIRGKLKEARSTKSYEIYKIVSQFVTKETLPGVVVPLKKVRRSFWADSIGSFGNKICAGHQQKTISVGFFNFSNFSYVQALFLVHMT